MKKAVAMHFVEAKSHPIFADAPPPKSIGNLRLLLSLLKIAIKMFRNQWVFHILIAILSKLCKNLEFSILFGGGASAKIGCDFASTKCIATAFFLDETRLDVLFEPLCKNFRFYR